MSTTMPRTINDELGYVMINDHVFHVSHITTSAGRFTLHMWTPGPCTVKHGDVAQWRSLDGELIGVEELGLATSPNVVKHGGTMYMTLPIGLTGKFIKAGFDSTYENVDDGYPPDPP